jgi:hypothetical protein
VIAVTKDTAYFAISFLAWAEGNQVGTGTIDTSGFFNGKRFSCGHNVANWCIGEFYMKDILVVGGGFEVHEKYGEG